MSKSAGPDKSDAQADLKTKAKYRKPTIRTESLTAVAAVCNGIAGGGRKASTGSPGFCSSTKLKS